MKIVRFCGRSSNDLYVLLSKNDWELGDPEGLAHWGPRGWEWVHRIDLGFSQQIGYVDEKLVIMDIDANLWYFTDQKLVRREAGPGQIAVREDVPPPSFYRFGVIESSDIVAVGDDGCVFIYDSTRWHRVETRTTDKLNDILECDGSLIVFGNKGAAIELRGTECRRVDSGTNDDFLQCGSGEDGSIYCLTYSSRTFSFVEFAEMKVIANHKLPHEILAMLVLNRNRIVYSIYDDVYLWDGMAITSLLPGYFVPQIEIIGRQIALASSDPKTGRPLLIFDPPNPRVLPVSLSESFLD